MMWRIMKFKPADSAPAAQVPDDVDADAMTRPASSRDTKFFWDGVNEHELRIQKRADGSLQHPPVPALWQDNGAPRWPPVSRNALWRTGLSMSARVCGSARCRCGWWRTPIRQLWTTRSRVRTGCPPPAAQVAMIARATCTCPRPARISVWSRWPTASTRRRIRRHNSTKSRSPLRTTRIRRGLPSRCDCWTVARKPMAPSHSS
jgi:hypothetical protein